MTTLTSPQLSLLLHILAGTVHIDGLNLAVGKNVGNGTTHWQLCNLRSKGLVTWQPAQARTLQLTAAGVELLWGLGYVRMPGGVGRWECWECDGVEA
jgi:hypothetical protein